MYLVYPNNIKGGDDTPLVRTTVSSKGGGAESQDTVEQGTEVYRNRYHNNKLFFQNVI